MTLAEFLDPLRKSAKKDQVLAALYYFKHQTPEPQATASKLKTELAAAQVPRARSANYSDVLARLVPNVHKVQTGRWEITETGENRVRSLLGIEDLGSAPAVDNDVQALLDVSANLKDEAVRAYVDEGIKCLSVDARRAAVVFIWAGAVHTLREEAWGFGSKAIDAALKSHHPKARTFAKKGDFAYVKDIDLLQVAQDFEIIDKSQKTMLEQGLDLRNSCGHPVKYQPQEKKVSGFVEDVLQIVFGVTA
jgi:hypothetical protein